MMVKLSDIVDEYMIEREQDSPYKFPYFMALAKMCLNILHREATGVIKQAKLPVGSNGTASLPNGCVKVARVFILDNFGCVIGLSQASGSVALNDNCGDVYKPCNYLPYYPAYPTDNTHLKNGYNVGAYYGYGGDSPYGTYHVNTEFGRIDFSSNPCASFVIIHYIGLPQKSGDDFYVHPYFTEAVKDFIDFKSVVRKMGILGEKRDREDRWTSSLIQAKMNLWGLSEDQVLDAVRHNFSPTPKT